LPGRSHDERRGPTIPPMPGGVIEVRRSERLGLFERLWLPGLLRAFWVVARHFYRSLGADPVGNPAPTPPYARPSHIRGMPVLVTDEGELRCVGCALCAEICPSQCIRLAPIPAGGSARGGEGIAAPAGAIESFEIDMARCFYCGLCEEACPADALVMSPLVEIAAANRQDLVFGLEALRVPASLLAGRTAAANPMEAPAGPRQGNEP